MQRARYRVKVAVMALMLLAPLAHAGAEEQQRDPWEPFNRSMFEFNEFLDRYLLRPTAVAYQKVTPHWLDLAITNVFSNLRDVRTLANELLQLKGYRAANTGGRILVNSTVGLLGLVDIASQVGAPRTVEDFGQTLVHYGVPQGPFLMVPLLGPSTVTAAAGFYPDSYLAPLSYMEERTQWVALGVDAVDTRADLIAAEGLIVGDRYTFVRNAYLQARDFQINDGKVEDDPFLNDDFVDDF